jgi:hypothetical protein
MRPSAKRERTRVSIPRLGPKRAAMTPTATHSPDGEYRVGPGHPPREYQFKPGQSGNPKGAKRKASSITPDLRALLQRALNDKVKMRRGERELIITKAAAGIDELVNQFVKGDPRARRDLIALADKLGVDLTAGQGKAIENAIAEAVSIQDQALLAEYLQHKIEEHLSGEDNVLRLPKPQSSNGAGLTNPSREGESK